MEDDKKKRKNKKKKNKQQQKKQAAALEDTSSNAGDTSSHEQTHLEDNEDDDHVGSNNLVQDPISNGSVSADIEKQNWLQEEAKLKEMVKQLLYEKDSYIQKQTDLELRIKQLQCENSSWNQKEVILEQRMSELLQEKNVVSLEEGNLRQKVQHVEKENFLLVEKESSNKELISSVSDENTRLKKQVLELEGARNSLAQENRQLLDTISTLESRIQDLERSLPSEPSPAIAEKDASEKEDLNAQIDAACSLVEKLVTENAELVEKVNELYMELNRQNSVPGVTSLVISDYAAVSDSISGEDISLSKNAKYIETAAIGNDRVMIDVMNSDNVNVVQHSSEATVSGDVVQIPLDEIEAQDLEAQTSPTRGDDNVSITDAPLIGAPFRLFSFVTKYVSGADLVDKSSSDSLQGH